MPSDTHGQAHCPELAMRRLHRPRPERDAESDATQPVTAFGACRKGWTLLYLTLILVMLPFIVLVALALDTDEGPDAARWRAPTEPSAKCR